ncbi:hypothetical protein [Paludisphaera soli]|uniref:hypothetical protein n=1 Tax=Paludisphaera soli TaxID=2712865 RepID=UPI0013ECAAD9|nr:hypothetical protein [Paludisphaera soli]
MTGRDFFFLWIGLMVGGAVHRSAASTGEKRPASDSAEQSRALRAFLLTVFAVLAIIYAILLAGFDLYILYRMIIGRDRWEPSLFLIIPGMAAASAFLGWLGIRLLRRARPAPDAAEQADWHLRAREAGAATRRAALDASERTRGFRAAFVAVFPFAALVYAAMLAGIALFAIGRLLLGQDRWEPALSLILPVVAVASALLAWLGLRLLRGRDLRAEYAQAWDDARGLYARTFDEGKPKPARDADLD